MSLLYPVMIRIGCRTTIGDLLNRDRKQANILGHFREKTAI
jgi:hypothetical protein